MLDSSSTTCRRRETAPPAWNAPPLESKLPVFLTRRSVGAQQFQDRRRGVAVPWWSSHSACSPQFQGRGHKNRSLCPPCWSRTTLLADAALGANRYNHSQYRQGQNGQARAYVSPVTSSRRVDSRSTARLACPRFVFVHLPST